MTRLCFVDTETTGLDLHIHYLWEVAIIQRDLDGIDTEWLFTWRPELSSADSTALRINKYWTRQPDWRSWEGDHNGGIVNANGTPISDKLLSPKIMATIVSEVTAESHLVGAVPSFDAQRLDVWMRRHGCAPSWHYHLIDIEPLAAGWLAAKSQGHLTQPGTTTAIARPPWNSKDLSAAVGVPPFEDAHTAMGDARWARAVYDRILHPTNDGETSSTGLDNG